MEDQNIELEPSRKIGFGKERQTDRKLPRHVAERIAEAERIAHDGV